MHGPTARLLLLPVLLASLLPVLGSSRTFAQTSIYDAPEESATIDLDFEGGTAVEYVEAVRRAASDLNILVRPDARVVRMDPVQLRNVDPESALKLLDRLRHQRGEQLVELNLQVLRSGMPGAHPLYTVDARVTPTGRPRAESSRVWSTTALVDGGVRAEDMLTAVETSLELLGETFPPVRLRFHRETGLLIARGHPEQLEAIQGVIGELRGSIPEKAALDREMALLRMDAEDRIAMLEGRLEDTTRQMQEAVREVAASRTRAELFDREIQSLHARLEGAFQKHRAELAEREAMIADLKHRLLQQTAPRER